MHVSMTDDSEHNDIKKVTLNATAFDIVFSFVNSILYGTTLFR